MSARFGIAALTVAVLAVALGAQGYERELGSRSIREAYFLGTNADRAAKFLQDYARAFPVPERGVQVERIELETPFAQVVARSQHAPDGYNPLTAEADYNHQPAAVVVEVTLELTPSFPAHTAYTIPVFSSIGFRDPDFWRDFEVHLVQQGEVEPRTVAGRPLYSCDLNGPCWLVGAVVRLEFDPEQVASRPARVVVRTPDGQQVETEFDLEQLR